MAGLATNDNRNRGVAKATLLTVAVAVMFGVFGGLGVFTFGYGKGYAYLGNNPATCTNCHVMQDYLNLTPSANAVLLPLVIVTVLIERFYVTTEEDGVGYSLQLIAGTIAVGAVCFTVLSWKAIGDLILVYPEIHLITIALFIAIGRYAGFRIAELYRFRDLVKTPDSN